MPTEWDAIVYEMHVRGFTISPTSGVASERRGTFAGIIDKVPYLKASVSPWSSCSRCTSSTLTRETTGGTCRLTSSHPIGLRGRLEHARDEFRAMVKALHAADIEVILDVVYNHTAEGNRQRPDLQLQGDRQLHLLPDDRRSATTLRRLFRVRQHPRLHTRLRPRPWSSTA